MKKKLRFWLLYFLAFLFITVQAKLVFSQAPEQDCINAIKVCQGTYEQNISYTGPGNTQELSYPENTSCMEGNETNSVWYIFTVNKSGVLTFQIQPENSKDDYDFTIYNLTDHSCSDIITGDAPQVRCNFSSTDGNTGLKEGFSNETSSSGESNQCAPMEVKANETYALLVNNFTSTENGYILSFGGTATIYDNTPPDIINVDVSQCSPRFIYLTFSENIQCSSISADGSDFSLQGPSNAKILSATSFNCLSNNLTNTVVIKLVEPINDPGTYYIKPVIGNDGNSLLDLCGNPVETDRVPIVVNYRGPTVLVEITEADCKGENGAAKLNVTGGTPPYTYLWDLEPPQTTAKATGLEAGVYSVLLTDANGCKKNVAVIVNNKNGPDVNVVSSSSSNCYGVDGGTAIAKATNGTPPYSYRWSTDPVQTTQTAKGLSSGTFTVFVSDAMGCISIGRIIINLPPPFKISTSKKDAECGKPTGSVEAFVFGGNPPYSYKWNTNPVQTTSAATGLMAGIYHLTVTDANKCTTEETVFISDINGPNVSVDKVYDATCHRPDGSIILNGSPNHNYEWITVPGNTGTMASGLNPGIHNIKITDSRGCIQVISIKLNDIPGPSAELSAVTDADCQVANGSATIRVVEGIKPYTFAWIPPGGTANDSIISGLGAGSYEVIISDSNNCSDTVHVDIGESGGENDFTFNQTCIGTPVTFDGTTTAASTVWEWDFGDPASGQSNFGASQHTTHIYSAEGIYTVTLKVSGGCNDDTVTKEVEIHPQPIISFNINPEYPSADSPTNFDYTGTEAGSYHWDFGDGSVSDQSDPVHVYANDDTIKTTLSIIDIHGCPADTAFEFIVFKPPVIYIPNCFTPNRDGLNDRFCVSGRSIEEIDLKIFDRWGNIIYSTQNVNEAMDTGWDGTSINSDPDFDTGVFGYHVKVKFSSGLNYERRGSVTVLK